MAIDSQVCFYRRLFADPVKLSCCITRPLRPLGSINQNWLGAKLLPMTVLIYPVICVHPCHLLRTQHHYLCPNDRENPPSACPLTLSPHDITGVVKNYLKNQQCIVHSRGSYETLAIRLLYLYSKSGVATL